MRHHLQHEMRKFQARAYNYLNYEVKWSSIMGWAVIIGVMLFFMRGCFLAESAPHPGQDVNVLFETTDTNEIYSLEEEVQEKPLAEVYSKVPQDLTMDEIRILQNYRMLKKQANQTFDLSEEKVITYISYAFAEWSNSLLQENSEYTKRMQREALAKYTD